MSKRVLHIASVSRASTNSGVAQQMEWERQAARRLGIEWDVELWTTEPYQPNSVLRQVPPYSQSVLARRFHFYSRLREAAAKYDFVVVRHAPLNPFGLFLPRRIRRKTWHVFHTKTGDYLRAKGKWTGPLLAWIDRSLTRITIRNSGGIIGVTDELVEYERSRLKLPHAKAIVYPNGLHLDEWDGVIPDRRDGPFKIAFVASRFFDWNGLEDLLKNIVESDPSPVWELHLVGQLMPHQRKYIAQNDLSGYIIEHGVLDAAAISSLLASMDLSLGAFALHKVDIRTACTLKVRESLGAGVPVYSGHSDVGVSGIDECYREGPADWSAILSMAAEARTRSKEDIRLIARPMIDKMSLLATLYEAIE